MGKGVPAGGAAGADQRRQAEAALTGDGLAEGEGNRQSIIGGAQCILQALRAFHVFCLPGVQ